MRKIILVSLVVFAVVIGGSMVITWFLQASTTKHNVEQLIQAINEKQPYITYDTIKTSGFPSEVLVTIVRPHFTGRMDQLIASLQQAHGKPATPMPEWNEDVTLDGNITLGINAMSDHYTLGISGNWVNHGKIGTQSIDTISQSIADSCVLEMGHNGGLFGSLWNFGALLNNRDVLKDFRKLDCSTSNYNVIDANSKAPLFTSAPSRFYASFQPQGDNSQFRFYMKFSDAEVTPAGDNLISIYFNTIAPDYPFSSKLSMYGKQNVEVDVSYSGPADVQNRNAKDAPFDVSINKFDINNLAYTSTTTFHLSHNVQGTNHVAKLAFKSEASFNEIYDTLLQDTVKRMVTEITSGKDPQYANLQPIIQKHTPDEWYAIIYPAVPNFHSLGKTVLWLDLGYQGNENLSAGDVDLTSLEISASPYGITGKGTAKLAQTQMVPTANVTLVCTNCLRMIDDVAAYWGRVEKVMAELNTTQPPQPPLDPKLVEGFKTFLSALAEPSAADKTTFAYALVSDGGSNIAINGKRIDEVMSLYNQQVAPFMQKPAAPAATPVPAPLSAQ